LLFLVIKEAWGAGQTVSLSCHRKLIKQDNPAE
jgi:hypothetical protein